LSGPMHPAIPMKMRRKVRVTQLIHPQASTERASEQVLPKHQPQLEYLLDRAADPPARGMSESRCQLIGAVREPAVRNDKRTEEERPDYEGRGELDDERAERPLLGASIREEDAVWGR
jgi:hypothetical protein